MNQSNLMESEKEDRMDSKGHLCWLYRGEVEEPIEYFERDGEVRKAPASDVIMPDGYRSGRWVCNAGSYQKLLELLKTSGRVK